MLLRGWSLGPLVHPLAVLCNLENCLLEVLCVTTPLMQKGCGCTLLAFSDCFDVTCSSVGSIIGTHKGQKDDIHLFTHLGWPAVEPTSKPEIAFAYLLEVIFSFLAPSNNSSLSRNLCGTF